MHVQSGTVDVSGALGAVTTIVEAGSTLTVGDPVVQYGGSMTVDGTLAAGGGVELMSGAWMNGSGLVQGDVLNTSGAVGPGNSVGTIEIRSYTQQGGGRLVLEVGVDAEAVEGQIGRAQHAHQAGIGVV